MVSGKDVWRCIAIHLPAKNGPLKVQCSNTHLRNHTPSEKRAHPNNEAADPGLGARGRA